MKTNFLETLDIKPEKFDEFTDHVLEILKEADLDIALFVTRMEFIHDKMPKETFRNAMTMLAISILRNTMAEAVKHPAANVPDSVKIEAVKAFKERGKEGFEDVVNEYMSRNAPQGVNTQAVMLDISTPEGKELHDALEKYRRLREPKQEYVRYDA